MPTLIEWIQLFPVVLPFVGALLVALIGKVINERYRRHLGWISAIFLFGSIFFIVTLYYNVLGLLNLALPPVIDIYYITGSGATFIHIDFLAIFMAVMFAFLGFFVTLYSIKYMENDRQLELYYPLLLTLIGSMIGVVFSGDFFSLFLFWETMSISSYALVAFRKDEAEPLEAGIKYFLLSAVGSTLILFTMSLLYGLTGTLSLSEIGTALGTLATTPQFSVYSQGIIMFTIVGLIIGFGVKAAIAPMATWLPDAHPAAPSGISAMLSGVVIMTGSYAILRTCILFYDPTIYSYYGYILSWFALFTMLYGNLMALTQKDLKRLLAYSTIVNVGYIIFGFALAMIPGISDTARYFTVTGSLFHITSHMLAKGMLFLCAGIFLHALHTRDLEKLRGVGRKMPITMLCFTIGALSLVGVPPLIGFFSKFFIIWGAALAGAYLAAFLLLLNSAFSVAYYLRLIQIFAFADPSPEVAKVREPSWIMWGTVFILMLFIVGIGLFPHFFITVANLAAQAALGLL